LADTYWRTRSVAKFRSASVELVLLDDFDQRYNIFLAALTGHLQQQPFYLGQQTRLTATGRTGGPGELTFDWSPGFVFSRWGDMALGSVRPAPRGRYLLSDHEGTHASIKVNQKWGKGRYTYRLERGETVRTPEGPFTWTTASVVCHADGTTQVIGSLRHPGEELVLDPDVGAFVEVYGYDPGPKTLPPFRLVLGNWRINDGPLNLVPITVRYPKGVPQVAVVKHVDQFFADGDCEKAADLPQGPDAVGIIVRPKPVPREPGEYIVWRSPYR
jgi:hypothetical protein